MASIVITTFDTEEEAKDHFAMIVQSTELHGAYVTKAGKVFLDKKADPIVDTKKWIVVSSGAAVISDG